MLVFNDFCVNCECPDKFCWLIDELVDDIKSLTAEIVNTRYELANCLPNKYRGLRSDILSDLSRHHIDDPAYQFYTELFYDGQDPFDSPEWTGYIVKLAHLHDG